MTKMTREEAAKKLSTTLVLVPKGGTMEYDEAISVAIKALLQETPKGRWIKSETMKRSMKCSLCKGWVTKHSVKENNFRFCPHCGADMRGEEE